MTQPQVAEVLGVGQQCISRDEISLLSKIRYALLTNGFTEDEFEQFIKYHL
jgi:DNA-directed RNA polymerase specialized sigma subunit